MYTNVVMVARTVVFPPGSNNQSLDMPSDLAVGVLGELAIHTDGKPVALPQSRKTRALFAFLALTGRTHRRERLCEMFWERPDDPRGSLRWALSKIRAFADLPNLKRVVADRERVSLQREGTRIDYLACRQDLQLATRLNHDRLRDIVEMSAQTLLEGLDMPQAETFQAWLVAEREEAAALHLKALRLFAMHDDTNDVEAIRWLRRWRTIDPFASEAAQLLAARLRKAGRAQEAVDVLEGHRRMMAQAGVQHDVPDAPEGGDVGGSNALPRLQQRIGFCRAQDGVRIAYATVGKGPPLVKAANWLNHLELDWEGPIWARTFETLASDYTLVRYDERGNGLSDWAVDDISFDAFVSDLETVVDALGLERFPLLGMSQGCAVSVEYAARHPERVSALVLLSGYAAGWRISASPEERALRESVKELTRLGWGKSNPAYRHIFSTTFMPDGTQEELAWFDELQRLTTSPENAVRFQDAFGDIDVRHRLRDVKVPTLVVHARQDQRIPVEQGRELAASIAGARFLPLESRSHIILSHEPAWRPHIDEVMRFLREFA